jgi:putative copper resistance protein D
MPTFLMLARAVHFGSCLILQGVFAVLLLVLLPAAAQAGDGTGARRERIDRLFRPWLIACLGLAWLSGFLWLWLSIAGMSGSTLTESLQPALFQMVLTQTQPGHVWLLRAGASVVLAVAIFLPRGAAKMILGGLSSVALTVSLAWLGHAGASEGPGQNVHLAADLLHLLAAGVWPAGLVPLAIYLRPVLRVPSAETLPAACAATRRFSNLSLCTVGILAVSGLTNSYFLVGSLHALGATDYGRVLIVKLLLFVAMVAIGAWNLLILKPQLDVVASGSSGDSQVTVLAGIRRNILIEIGLGILVVFVVCLLGIMPPASHG